MYDETELAKFAEVARQQKAAAHPYGSSPGIEDHAWEWVMRNINRGDLTEARAWDQYKKIVRQTVDQMSMNRIGELPPTRVDISQ